MLICSYASTNRRITPVELPADVNDDGMGDIGDGVQGDEDTYCYCNRVSFGEMVACDRPDCAREWYNSFYNRSDPRFHLECAGLKAPPEGQWFCRDCKRIMERERRSGKKAKIEGGKVSR
jgi:inhibitor of growth protein 3